MSEKSIKFSKQLMEDGTNLMIIGYDAYPMDGSRPFGHKLILVLDKSKYPWNLIT